MGGAGVGLGREFSICGFGLCELGLGVNGMGGYALWFIGLLGTLGGFGVGGFELYFPQTSMGHAPCPWYPTKGPLNAQIFSTNICANFQYCPHTRTNIFAQIFGNLSEIFLFV